MPTMFCPDCAADLDAVPVETPCPACGGRRRSAHVQLAVGALLSELAALPAQRAREATGRLIAAATRTANVTASAVIVEAARAGDALADELHRGGSAEPLVGAAALGAAHGIANDTLIPQAPTVEWLLQGTGFTPSDVRGAILAMALPLLAHDFAAAFPPFEPSVHRRVVAVRVDAGAAPQPPACFAPADDAQK